MLDRSNLEGTLDAMRLSLSEIKNAAGAVLVGGDQEREILSISTDTRSIKEGDLFIGLSGPNFDGALFAGEALSRGAAGIMASHLPKGVSIPEDRFYLEVPDAVKAMGDIAALWRQKINLTVLAVMGSSGKTTTKEMLVHVLSKSFRTVFTRRNYNNTIGVPLTMFELEPDTELLIVELGMNLPGEMRQLAKIADPDYLAVTNIGCAHIGMFGSREKLIRAKAEVFDKIRPDCLLIVNSGCPHTPAFLEHARHSHPKVSFGLEGQADVHGSSLRPVSEGRYDCTCSIKGKGPFPLHVPMYGRYNVENALAAMAAAWKLGMDPVDAGKLIRTFKPSSMRSEVKDWKGVRIIVDCYNANPDSMRKAILSMEDAGGRGRSFALLGGMLELGDETERFHREIGRLVSERGFRFLVTLGDPGRYIGEEASRLGVETVHAGTHLEAANLISSRIRPGDRLLVKGSRLVRLEEAVNLLVSNQKQDEKECCTCS